MVHQSYLCPKKTADRRMHVDYWALNKQMIKVRYQLPGIDLHLDWLGQARVFSKLDLAQGYHQIAMAKDSVEKIARFARTWANGNTW